MEWQIFEGGEKKMENAKAWKKKWEYNYQKGLRGAMISVDAVEQDEKLYFVLHYGEANWESLLIGDRKSVV